MEVVIVEIDRSARITVRVEGVAGPVCRDLTARLEGALGRTTHVTPTPEMHQEAHAHAGIAARSR